MAGLKRSREIVFITEKRNPGQAVIHDNLADTRKVLNRLVYEKGGWTLHMLRAQIGTEPFWSGIRDYYRQYRDGNASTDDFRRVMEKASGQKLTWFFQQWLNRAGSPVIEGSWKYRAEDRRIDVEVAQAQSGELYRLPLEIAIAIDGAGEPRIERVLSTERNQHFEIPSEKAPSAVALDPNCSILMKATFVSK